MPRRTTVIPSAARLMTSLRDIGYDLPSAIADLVDNSVDAGATTVQITVGRGGGTSFIRIADDGCGMTDRVLDEAMRYGSRRAYEAKRPREIRTRSEDSLTEPVPPSHRGFSHNAARPDPRASMGSGPRAKSRRLGTGTTAPVRVHAVLLRAAQRGSGNGGPLGETRSNARVCATGRGTRDAGPRGVERVCCGAPGDGVPPFSVR